MSDASKTKLSERVRPDCEAAPWVIEEIKQLEAELARLRAGQEPASRAHIMDALLMWNRRHEAPPIKVGYEYGVAEAVIDLIGTTPQPSAVPDDHTEQVLAMVQDGWKLAVDNVAGYAHLYNSGSGIIHEIRAEHARLLAAAPSAPKVDDPVKVQLLEALEEILYAEINSPISMNNAGCIKKMQGIARAAIAAARKGGGE